jgi:hypothetical protein
VTAAMRLRKGPPSVPWMLAALGAVSAGIAAVGVLGNRSAPSEPSSSVGGAPALEAYAAAIAEPTRQAGRSIIAGIRPDISDFRTGRISAAVWKTDMVARSQEFAGAWAAIAAAERPRAVATAQASFDDAFRTYLLAARTLYDAGDRDGAERETFIELGAALGDEGDHAFDRGAVVVQRARKDAGLLPDRNLPNPNTDPEANP